MKPIVKLGKAISITFEGKALRAYEGETIATALYRNGVRVFGRSFKYRRPRGPFCFSGNCARCLVRVDGVSNIRSCRTQVREGMAIERQRGWPSADFDAPSFFLNREVGPGFQYKHGLRLWSAYKWIYERLVGIGEALGELEGRFKHKSVEVDLSIIGGGVAGLAAINEAHKWGVESLLIEGAPWLGGRIALIHSQIAELSEFFPEKTGFEIASSLSSDVDVVKNTTAFGFYEPNTIAASSPDTFYEVKAKSCIIATGGYERNIVFENNDMPGIISSVGVLKLLNGYGVKPGDSCVLVGGDRDVAYIARELLDAGINVTMIGDAPVEGIQSIEGRIVGASGRNRVDELLLTTCEGRVKKRVDFVVLAGGLIPTYELLHQAGCNLIYEGRFGGFVAEHDGNMKCLGADNIFLAGDVAGQRGFKDAYIDGKVAALSAIHSLTGAHEALEDMETWKERRR
ncbi:MAG: 2Fe-2S iron-sulfur cluster-binding protein [Candidatus Geothermarchaeales archaeon]